MMSVGKPAQSGVIQLSDEWRVRDDGEQWVLETLMGERWRHPPSAFGRFWTYRHWLLKAIAEAKITVAAEALAKIRALSPQPTPQDASCHTVTLTPSCGPSTKAGMIAPAGAFCRNHPSRQEMSSTPSTGIAGTERRGWPSIPCLSLPPRQQPPLPRPATWAKRHDL
jgi:hypothetical protein